jgi:hypothetical protein
MTFSVLQTGIIDDTPVKSGKLPLTGRVNLAIQFNKYSVTDKVKEQLMDLGAATDCDVYRPLFCFYDIDAKVARRIIQSNRRNLLCILMSDTDYNTIYQRSSTVTAYNFFLSWINTGPDMYRKKVSNFVA